jgi:hypothetical protein
MFHREVKRRSQFNHFVIKNAKQINFLKTPEGLTQFLFLFVCVFLTLILLFEFSLKNFILKKIMEFHGTLY